MKIFCICLVKNEMDIIEQTLVAATAWSDAIFVYDNGSTDGTWEKVVNLAKSLRRNVFIDKKNEARDGDWWCFLDSDEIYIDDPRQFLAEVPQYYQAVWNASLQFFMTDEDLKRYEEDPMQFAECKPIEEKARYYLSDWSEARFFKYDRKLAWSEGEKFPYAGAIYPKRIRLKHYKYRSPQQLERRTAARRATIQSGTVSFLHERRIVDWRSHVRQAAKLDFDAHDGRFVVREELMPKLPITARLPPRLVNLLRGLKGYGRQLKGKR
jgi:glycosyltransferase involved in cell wall biosynthesis